MALSLRELREDLLIYMRVSEGSRRAYRTLIKARTKGSVPMVSTSIVELLYGFRHNVIVDDITSHP